MAAHIGTISFGPWTARPSAKSRKQKFRASDEITTIEGDGEARTSAHTCAHETHISTHLIERSSALHSCLLAVLTLQSSAAVVTPIYNWYPQHGMGCLPCLKGSAQRLRILTTSCPVFQGAGGERRWWERRWEWPIIRKPCPHPPTFFSHTRWPLEQSRVLSFLHIYYPA